MQVNRSQIVFWSQCQWTWFLAKSLAWIHHCMFAYIPIVWTSNIHRITNFVSKAMASDMDCCYSIFMPFAQLFSHIRYSFANVTQKYSSSKHYWISRLILFINFVHSIFIRISTHDGFDSISFLLFSFVWSSLRSVFVQYMNSFKLTAFFLSHSKLVFIDFFGASIVLS